MPPKIKVSQEEILNAAVDVVREKGADALNARALARQLGCSTQPIFSNYSSMEELKGEVIRLAAEKYQRYLKQDMSSGEYPAYKASGMAYIRFAKEETALFKLLFMRDRSGEKIGENEQDITAIVDIIQKNTGLSRERAYMFHLEMWVYVHGIATMIATAYLDWDRETVSSILTDAYEGLKKRFGEVD